MNAGSSPHLQASLIETFTLRIANRQWRTQVKQPASACQGTCSLGQIFPSTSENGKVKHAAFFHPQPAYEVVVHQQWPECVVLHCSNLQQPSIARRKVLSRAVLGACNQARNVALLVQTIQSVDLFSTGSLRRERHKLKGRAFVATSCTSKASACVMTRGEASCTCGRNKKLLCLLSRTAPKMISTRKPTPGSETRILIAANSMVAKRHVVEEALL